MDYRKAPPKPNISYTFTLITPSKARELLQLNTKNRAISMENVRQYAVDMLNDDFDYNGHTVCVSDTNVLLDGQQRLTACINSNTPFWTMLITNMDEATMVTIDSGRKRTYSDRLKIRGYTESASLAGVLSHVGLIARKDPKHYGFTPSELDKVLELHPDTEASAVFAKGSYLRCDTVIGAIHYIAHQTGYGSQGDEFVRTWRDGQMNYEDDPIVFIRERLNSDATKINKMTTKTKQRLIMLAWNKFKDMTPLRAVKLKGSHYQMDGWTPEVCGISSPEKEQD